uniref:Peptidyl-prolyl cis-trans isomerase n=1 Tax=Spongospora subterranea TaxID=70186 RepID=A0A0H5R891_9EUKA|eukprot:CRZ04539.1 hypothetical protein [Spongospora subterranea]
MSTNLQDRYENLSKESNPVVFLDIAIGSHDAGRVLIELFADTVPRTCENFRQFCTGEFKRNSLAQGYKGAKFHRIIKDFMCQGGDFLNGDGTGCTSIYGERFADESFGRRHDSPFLLSMANSGPNSNGCQFFILTQPSPWLDNKHVVFGKVIEGFLTVRKIEAVPTGKSNLPTLPILITQCGQM